MYEMCIAPSSLLKNTIICVCVCVFFLCFSYLQFIFLVVNFLFTNKFQHQSDIPYYLFVCFFLSFVQFFSIFRKREKKCFFFHSKKKQNFVSFFNAKDWLWCVIFATEWKNNVFLGSWGGCVYLYCMANIWFQVNLKRMFKVDANGIYSFI